MIFPGYFIEIAESFAQILINTSETISKIDINNITFINMLC